MGEITLELHLDFQIPESGLAINGLICGLKEAAGQIHGEILVSLKMPLLASARVYPRRGKGGLSRAVLRKQSKKTKCLSTRLLPAEGLKMDIAKQPCHGIPN